MPVDWFPLWLSLRVAAVATVLSLPAGVWLGWRRKGCARRGGDGWRAVAGVPPTVLLGWVALLLVGEGTLVVGWMAAVVAGMCEAVPVAAVLGQAALGSVVGNYERAARSLGASGWRVFWRVSLPLARGPLLAVALVAFARVLGDFGLTLIVAGFAVGRGSILDASLRQAVESAGGGEARVLAVVISVALVAAVGLAGPMMRRRVTR